MLPQKLMRRRRHVVNKEMQRRYALALVMSATASTTITCSSFYVVSAMWELESETDFVIQGITICVFVFAINLFFTYRNGMKLSNKVAGPLHNLLKLFDRVGEGDYEARAKFRQADELHYVADGFNEMVIALESKDSKLRNSMKLALEALERGNSIEAKEILLMNNEAHVKIEEAPAKAS